MLKSDRPPNFICVGSQKCGTTWLYDNLCLHPDCSMPAIKELRYFHPWHGKKEIRNDNPYFGKILSLEEYKNSFGNKISGDITPEYFNQHENPELIKKTFPNVKLFVILRNPIHRAFSQYKMEKYDFPNIPICQSFRNTFENNYQNIQNRGFYDIHLEQFLKFFDIDKNFKVYLFDELIADQKKFFYNLCDYIGIKKVDTGILYDFKNSNNNEIISKTDFEFLYQFYKKSIKNLEEILNKQIKWQN